MIHYHGTPITPKSEMLKLIGRNFCVSHADRRDVKRAHEIGQSVMLDNGAFSKFKSGKEVNWANYYEWADTWLDYPTTWAVIPDVIDGNEETQDELIKQWPHGIKGSPVWHMHESIDRLLRLVDQWPRVCFGSSAQYWNVLSPIWEQRTDSAWEEISKRHKRTPNIHMLRGLQTSGKRWPFASADSTDVARNWHIKNNICQMADRWDSVQCPPKFVTKGN